MTGRLSRVEQRELTRGRLLDAAERLFSERGFSAVTVDQIAEAAGFTIGALYSNFSGKEELFLAVTDRWTAQELGDYRAAFDRGETDAARLQSLADWLAADLDQVLPRLRTEVEFLAYAASRPEAAARIRTRQRDLLAGLAASVTQQCATLGGNPALAADDLALVVAALSNGLALQRLIDPDIEVGRVFGATIAALLSAEDRRPGPAPSDGRRPSPTRNHTRRSTR